MTHNFHSLGRRAVALVCAAAVVHAALAQAPVASSNTTSSGAAQSAPPAAIPVPGETPRPDSSVSGPGSVFSPDGPVYKQRMRANASAVRDGLIPPIRPLLDLHIRDTIIRPGADGNYYMTGSTGADIWNQNAAGIELWRSADLKKWDYLGVVWNMERDGTWEKQHPWGRYSHAIWAPEIIYIKRLKNYFLTYSLPPGDRGILKSITGKPEGPYVNALAGDGKLRGEIDLCLFEDDDGAVYATWGPNLLARMKDDLSGFAEEPRTPKLADPDMDPAHHATTCPPRRDCQDIGHEGPSLFKKDGKYYLTAADTYLGRYSSCVAISDNVYGPYKLRHEGVPGGGGGNYFEDKEGNWWCTYFGNDNQQPWREMPAIIKVEFGQDGKISVAQKQPDFVLDPQARGGKSPWSDGGKAASGPPLLGWSSWSSTWNGGGQRLNEDFVKAHADVMADKLKSSGYLYINLDDGWARGFDEHGRLQADGRKFPGGIAALADYVHKKGLKLGLYLTPGLRAEAWEANGTIAGTEIHLRDIADPAQNGNTQRNSPGKSYHIDFTKPGAREYIQSYADLLASWGVDYIKMDFVGPGGGNQKADTREDIKQWQAALKKTDRPIWLELSNSLSFENVEWWKAYSNGWRIENDVEAYSRTGPPRLTTWAKVAVRFKDAPKWAPHAGPGGWNDLDSLELGNGDADGLTMDERHSVMTLWSICCSPLILGSDLTKLDDGDLAIITHPEVLAINQAGQVATPLSQTPRNKSGGQKMPTGLTRWRFSISATPKPKSPWHGANWGSAVRPPSAMYGPAAIWAGRTPVTRPPLLLMLACCSK